MCLPVHVLDPMRKLASEATGQASDATGQASDVTGQPVESLRPGIRSRCAMERGNAAKHRCQGGYEEFHEQRDS